MISLDYSQTQLVHGLISDTKLLHQNVSQELWLTLRNAEEK
jgi:hypothetical protein